MTELLEFLSQHVLTLHFELGFVPIQNEPLQPDHQDMSNVIDLKSYNELKHEVAPDYYEDGEESRFFGFR